MTKTLLPIAAMLIAAGGIAIAQSAGAPSTAVESLRGAQPDEEIALAPVYHPQEGRKERNYRLQPPIIPHTIDRYQIDVKANQCLACHDWRTAADRGAPTLSMTHYTTRDGIQTDQVAARRWFCNQCHVPQVDAPALVENLFRGSEE